MELRRRAALMNGRMRCVRVSKGGRGGGGVSKVKQRRCMGGMTSRVGGGRKRERHGGLREKEEC